MANPEHEAILRQGVAAWNQWRGNNLAIKPDLSATNLSATNLSKANLSRANLGFANLSFATLIGANLSKANLGEANLSHSNFSSAILSGAFLSETNLSGTTLRSANLRSADLSRADLSGANLNEANLSRANLSNATLSGANLSSADLNYVNLNGVDLSGANLTGANANQRRVNLNDADLSEANLSHSDFSSAILSGADLSDAILAATNLSNAICVRTIFANIDLSTTKGLDTIRHLSPSTLGIDTIFRSKGKIPEIFLRGCGVPETLITYLPSMMEDAIVFYSCFISYSHADKEFAKRLHDRLQGVGIRCWLDEHQLNVGDKLQPTIYEAIRVYDKVILCCSETSLKSWWVEKEFENVIAKEEDFHEPLLIPVALDNYLFEQSADAWFIGEIRKKRLVQSFENWKDHDAFEAAFANVVKALRQDGGKPPPPAPKLTPRK